MIQNVQAIGHTHRIITALGVSASSHPLARLSCTLSFFNIHTRTHSYVDRHIFLSIFDFVSRERDGENAVVLLQFNCILSAYESIMKIELNSIINE